MLALACNLTTDLDQVSCRLYEEGYEALVKRHELRVDTLR